MKVPAEVKDGISTTDCSNQDNVLILSASWEERCLGLTRKLDENYKSEITILNVYDTPSELRSKHIVELRELLEKTTNKFYEVSANHGNSLLSVRNTINIIKSYFNSNNLKLSIDISCFTRKHLLQLLQGLDLANLLQNCQFFYTEPTDYDTKDDEPISKGIRSVKSIESFMGQNYPSKDSLLILFLGYEGRRALAIKEHLEPNITIPVIPDPPFREDWANRTESQNCYLLSTIHPELVYKSHSLNPEDTENLLINLKNNQDFGIDKYNYRIAPLGTKPQTLGLYRFWRNHRGLATIMYASPVKYREDITVYSIGRTWLVDKSELWYEDGLL